MSYLQIGAPKSGNYWLYKILQQIRHTAQLSVKSYITDQCIYAIAKKWKLNYPEQASIDVIEIDPLQIRYRISSIFQMPIDDIADYANRTNLVWTHSRYNPASPQVLKHFQKRVYIIRDPRDRLLSAARYYTSAYMLHYFPQKETEPGAFLLRNFEALLHEWVWHVYDYLRLHRELDIHICFYEGFKNNFLAELKGLLSYLELDLNSEEQIAIQHKTTFSNMKKSAPDHLVKGKSGLWNEILPESYANPATDYTLPLLQKLGYGRNGWDASAVNLENIHYSQLKEELIAAQKIVLPNTELPPECF